MASLTIRTHASAPETLIPGEGVLVPASGASTTFDEDVRINRLKVDPSLYALLTDDVYGVNASTLVLVDLGGTDVPQALAADFLVNVGGPSKITAHKRDVTDPKLVYWGRSSASPGSENTAAAEWQIFQTDDRDVVFSRAFANGNEGFVHVWDDRAAQTY
jgi:hypothetical protein